MRTHARLHFLGSAWYRHISDCAYYCKYYPGHDYGSQLKTCQNSVGRTDTASKSTRELNIIGILLGNSMSYTTGKHSQPTPVRFRHTFTPLRRVNPSESPNSRAATCLSNGAFCVKTTVTASLRNAHSEIRAAKGRARRCGRGRPNHVHELQLGSSSYKSPTVIPANPGARQQLCTSTPNLVLCMLLSLEAPPEFPRKETHYKSRYARKQRGLAVSPRLRNRGPRGTYLTCSAPQRRPHLSGHISRLYGAAAQGPPDLALEHCATLPACWLYIVMHET